MLRFDRASMKRLTNTNVRLICIFVITSDRFGCMRGTGALADPTRLGLRCMNVIALHRRKCDERDKQQQQRDRRRKTSAVRACTTTPK